MKKVLLSAGMLVALTATAQNAQQGNTGINTSSPSATLEVRVAGINASNDTNQGVLIPKLTKVRVAGIADTKLVKGTLVFVEGITYAGTNVKVSDINADGFYYYNGTKWVKVEGSTLPNGTANGQVLKWNGSGWIVGTDTNTTYTAGTGLTLSGTTFSANPAAIALGGDVTGNANANTVAKIQGRAVSNTAPTNGQVLKWNQAENIWKPENDANTNTTYTGSTSVVLSGTSFQRAALSGDVTSAQNNNTVTINNGAVTGAKIANGTITADKLAAGVIPTVPAEVDGIVGNEVTNATTARGLVRAGEGTNASPYTLGVADNGITNAMIANNAINSAKIQDGAITGADIANGTITANKLAAGVIPTDTNTNIYSNDGTLGGNRTIAMGDNNLMFTGTGKVGFGTATPRAKMDIVGGLRASKGDATEDASNVGYAFDGDGDTGLFATGGAATNGSDLILKNDNVTALTVKAGTRNIGIGTTNPSAKLDVAGGGRFKGTVDHILRIQRDGQTDFTDFVKRENGTFLITNNTADTWKGGITIDANANVGIGTYTPTTKLDVEGSIKSSALSGTGDRVVLADATGVLKTGTLPANTNIYSNDGTLSANRTVNLNGKNLLFTGISDTAGKIGLGTTNPTAALTIVGTGEASDDIAIKSFSSSTSKTSTIFLERHRGTASAPAAVQVGDDLGGIVYKGYTSSGNLLDGVVLISKVREVTANSLKADLFINSNSVGIGVVTPAAKLDVAGDIKTNSVIYNSDARLKIGVNNISNATATINGLRGVTYHWNELGKTKGGNDKLQYGFIAQEVEKVLPSLVNTDAEGYKSVNYVAVIPVLVKALQEKDEELKALKTEIESIKKVLKK